MLPSPRPCQLAQLCLLGLDSCWPFAFSTSYQGGSQGLSNRVILGNQPHESSPFFLNRYHLQFSAEVFKHINSKTLQRMEMCVIHLF